MADSEEYELLPRRKVQELRSELDNLKRNPLSNTSSNKELVRSIDRFTRSVDRLYALFENVQKEVLEDYQKGEKPEDKLDKVIEQNKHIAHAIISVTENLNENAFDRKEKYSEPKKEEPKAPEQKPRMPEQQDSSNIEWTNTQEFPEEPPRLRPQQNNQGMPPKEPMPQPNTGQQINQAPQPQPAQQSKQQESQEMPPRFEVPTPPEEEPKKQGLPELPNIGQQSAQGNNPWMDSQNPYRQNIEVPPTRANYPSPLDYPSIQGEPQLTKPLHAEPEKKKKYMGFF